MKIKVKLTLGIGLLFTMIIILGVVGGSYIKTIKSDTENILVDNYITLEYTRNMLLALEDDREKALSDFEENLVKQENNITETGEGEATGQLRLHFDQYKSGSTTPTILKSIRKEIFSIMDMNMQAIKKKSRLAEEKADSAIIWIAITGTTCFLIAFFVLIKLPSNIVNPIKRLTAGIQQIAKKNYSERLKFEGQGELQELTQSFNVMAEKLEEYDQSNLSKIMTEKKRIETIINNMHDPVIVLDENMRIIFVNQEATKVTGLSQIQMIGELTQNLATKNDLIQSLIQDFTITDNSKGKQKVNPMKIYNDDRESYFEKEILKISMTPTGEENKILVGYVIILRNVTEYKELDFAKTNFVATVSHEFKTPISSIKMSLQLLKNEQIGSLNLEQKQLLESINEDAERLIKITTELLNITQVESGNIKLAISPVNPKDILNYALDANKTQADQKQIKFDISVPENLPKILVDKEKTEWVLVNIISNAIRYSYDNSSVEIVLAEKGKKIQFIVQDSGQGIPAQYLDKVFKRYFRVPGTKREGVGLGLAISKEFVEAQGGAITVTSELGAGSIFTVSFNAADT